MNEASDARATGFAGLPTAAKILLLMLLALFPLGLAISVSSYLGLRDAQRMAERASNEQADAATRAIDGLIARNSLALRLAANAALHSANLDQCAATRATLGIAPAVERDFSLVDPAGKPICSLGDPARFAALRDAVGSGPDPRLARPGGVALWVAPDQRNLVIGVGVDGGAAIEEITLQELHDAALRGAPDLTAVTLGDGARTIDLANPADIARATPRRNLERRLGDNRLVLTLAGEVPRIAASQTLLILLPLVMWLAAALLGWLQANRLLIRPLRRLERAISAYQPGDDAGQLIPAALGPAREIRELGEAFVRTLERIEETERAMAEALDGQRRLVREVHHRVKNNLQVIASLLSIHGRAASDGPAREAYAAIARRVEALSVVHRNHYAEMEESRGIALRPMLTELGAGLRSSAPDAARETRIELDSDSLSTTQDAAVAAAFFITEIVECTMLSHPGVAIDVVLRRKGELEGRLSIGSAVLVPLSDDQRDEAPVAQIQFERILEALARQLRSPLERKLGRYSVTLPVFPEA